MLKFSTYHRKDIDLAVIWFSPRTYVNWDTSTICTVQRPTITLEKLDRLPLELTQQICLQLDIATLLSFRQVNGRLWKIVNTLYEYRVVTTNASNALCALLQIGSASRVTY